MFQVKAFNRHTDEVIMESDTFDTLREAGEMLSSVGHGENYYALLFRLQVQEVF